MSEPTPSGDATAQAPLPPGFVQFYDAVRPGLAPGTYQLSATQRIHDVPTGSYFEPRTQSFTVDAPRFALEAGDVGEMYPPANSSGDFGATLPSVVLNRRTLPWERQSGADPDGPWMALLVLRPDELASGGATAAAPRTQTVAQFLDRSDPGVRPPSIDPEGLPAQILADEMTSLTLPLRVFLRIAPAADDARLLAHVRRTDTASRAEGQAAKDGWHAVVVANRLPVPAPARAGIEDPNGPRPGSTYLACLISLEGLTDYLPGRAAPPAEDADLRLRLAVLASWSFTSNPAGRGDLGRLLAALVPGPSAGPEALLPRVPVPPGAAPSGAATRLRQGYTALSYRLPTGEQTFAWYRGPFTPYPAHPLPAPANGAKHYATAAEVTVYSAADGIFDLSYAAAFEAGRIAALADRGFAVSMVNARRAAFAALAALQSRDASPLFAQLRPAAAAPTPPPPTPPPASGAVAPSAEVAAPAAPSAVPGSAAPSAVSAALKSEPEPNQPGALVAVDLLAARTRDAFTALLESGLVDRLTTALADAPADLGRPTTQPEVVPPTPPTPPPTPPARGPVQGGPPGMPGADDPWDLPFGHKGSGPGADPLGPLKALLDRADVLDLLAANARGPAADPATGWLAELALLHRIPFRHLIPDSRMLPVESLRFFYLDSGWIAALIDGALSIGVEGSRDLELHQAVSRPMVAAVAAKVGAVRAARQGRPDLAVPTGAAALPGAAASAAAGAASATGGPDLPVPTDAAAFPGAAAGTASATGGPDLPVPTDAVAFPAAAAPAASATGGPDLPDLPHIPGRPDRPGPGAGPDPVPDPDPDPTALPPASGLRSGLLLRSAPVAGWPGLQVEGRAAGARVGLLRLDRLSDSVLLALFDGVPDTVTLTEPWHGLHFGLGDDEPGDGGRLALRRPDGAALGERFPAAGRPGLRAAFTRSADRSVLRVAELADALHARLAELLPGPDVPVGSALLATELLASARRLTFRTTGTEPSAPSAPAPKEA